jgi:hypothetical protein
MARDRRLTRGSETSAATRAVAGRMRQAAERHRPLVLLSPLLLIYLAALFVLQGNGGDENALLQYTDRILDGGYAHTDPRQPEEFLWRGPGIPVLLAPFVALDLPILVPRLLMPLSLFGAVLALYHALRFRLDATTSLLGAYAFGLFMPIWKSVGSVVTEPVATLCLCLALLGWVAYQRDGARAPLVGCGVALGVLALVRTEYGYLITLGLVVGAAVWAVRRTRTPKAVTVVCAIGLACCVPWLAYTYSMTDRHFYWGNAGALNLYWMTSPDPDDVGDPHVYEVVFRNPDYVEHRPLFRRLETMPPIEQSDELQRISRENIADHPTLFARNVGLNLSRMIVNHPFSYTGPKPSILFYGFFNGLLLAAAAAGVVAARRRKGFWALAGPPLAFAVLSFAAHVPVAGYPRYWVPVVPVFVWFATMAVGPAVRDRLAPAGRHQAA